MPTASAGSLEEPSADRTDALLTIVVRPGIGSAECRVEPLNVTISRGRLFVGSAQLSGSLFP
jgi:hypothetical protein